MVPNTLADMRLSIMNMTAFILNDDHTTKEVPFLEACQWWTENNERRIVKQTTIGEFMISTVFLCFNHAFDDGIPLLFETMIFGPEGAMDQRRYATWTGAVDGHEDMIKKLVNEYQS